MCTKIIVFTSTLVACSIAFNSSVNVRAQGTPADVDNDLEKLEGNAQAIDEWFLFFPSEYPAGDWKPNDLTYSDVDFASADGTKLHGWFCPANQARGVILLAHGNAGNVAGRARWLRILQERLRVSVFAFDYRGYGRSEGTPTVKGVIEDARAARAKVCELAKIDPSELIIMGESLGGAIAVELAAERPVSGLVLQSTFSSLKDVAEVHFAKLSWLVDANKLNSTERIKYFQGALLQSHGTQDSTVPFSLGEKLFNAANEPKKFVRIQGAEHNNWLTPEYIKSLDEFIRELKESNETNNRLKD